MTHSTFAAPLATPFYTDHVLYHVIQSAGIPTIRAWEFHGWQAESMSWKKGCYIHAGLSNTGPLSLKGPDALKFLESLCINSFVTFPIGSMKHAVMCDENGLIGAHGILERKAEDEFEFFAAPPWPLQKLAGSSYRVQAPPPHRLSLPNRWTYVAEDAREGNPRKPQRYPVPPLPQQSDRRHAGRSCAHRYDG